jgi:hypothetical protein
MRRIFLCPQAIANLLSINQFCKDNDCFFILTGSHFFIKDNQTCDDPFFFFFLKHTNGYSQWHDNMSLSQHMAHAP